MIIDTVINSLLSLFLLGGIGLGLYGAGHIVWYGWVAWRDRPPF